MKEETATRAPAHRIRVALLEPLALVCVLALPLAAALWGARGPAGATLNVGPNDAYYLTGFSGAPEVEGEIATRWTGRSASIDLPLSAEGPVRLLYRVARVLPETAEVEVSLDGRAVDHFRCRGGAWLLRVARPGVLPRTPVRLALDVAAGDERSLGLRVDWARVEVERGGVLRLRGWALLRPLLLVAVLFAALRLAGFRPAGAAGLVLPAALVLAAGTLRDPFAVAHLTMHLAPPAGALALLSAALLRKQGRGRWLLVLLLASYGLKGAVLFHPAFFYYDSHNHARFVQAMGRAEGSVLERGLEAQRAVNTAHPRYVAGKAYTFPYSPLFFVPFTHLRNLQHVEDGMRHLGLLMAALEVLLAAWLARLAFGERTGLFAAVLAATLPPLSSRVLLAMWPTITAHALEVLAIGSALLYLREPTRRRLAVLAAFTLAAFLTYVSSLFNLCLFLGALALLARRRLPVLLGVAVSTAAATVLLLYLPFTRVFLAEILPALLSGHGAAAPAAAGATAPGGPLAALSRVPLFYGWAVPPLALAGLWLTRRKAAPEARTVLLAYALAVASLYALRGLGGGLFKDLKETTFAVTLAAVLVAAVLDELAGRGRSGRVAAALVLVGLAAFGLDRLAGHAETYADPVVALARDAPG